MPERLDPFDRVDAPERALKGAAKRVDLLLTLCVVVVLIIFAVTLTATHRNLFFDEPLTLELYVVKLPIDSPFFWFFTFGPIIFVIGQIYLMVEVRQLAHSAADYNTELINRIGSERELILLRLADAPLAQLLVRATSERWLDLRLRAVALIPLALVPVGIILLFQYQFLPYHQHVVTWLHRGLLLIVELPLLFIPFRYALDAVFSSKNVIWRVFVPAAPWLMCVVFSLLLAFPGEPHLGLLKWFIKSNPTFCETILNVNDHLELPFLAHNQGAPNNQGTAKEPGPPNNQATPSNQRAPNNQATPGNQATPINQGTPNLQGRDLSCGNFKEAHLEGANLTNANLQNAFLTKAVLNGAILSGAQLRDADFSQAGLTDARLDGANLARTQLQSAHLENVMLNDKTNLEHAFFAEADLKGVALANMKNLPGGLLFMAQLQNANLTGADLQKKDLSGAQLEGADLSEAKLQEAKLFEAKLYRAKLISANLQRAFLLGADLEQADLDGAQLQGADLSLAKLRRADLRGADLRGADLTSTDLSGAQLQGAKLQGAKRQGANFTGADLTDAEQ